MLSNKKKKLLLQKLISSIKPIVDFTDDEHLRLLYNRCLKNDIVAYEILFYNKKDKFNDKPYLANGSCENKVEYQDYFRHLIIHMIKNVSFEDINVYGKFVLYDYDELVRCLENFNFNNVRNKETNLTLSDFLENITQHKIIEKGNLVLEQIFLYYEMKNVTRTAEDRLLESIRSFQDYLRGLLV